MHPATKSIYTITLLLLYGSLCIAQPVRPSPAPGPSPARIDMTTLGNDMVQFSASLPPLRQLAGAPKAYYSYFWDFGDGTFNDINLVDRERPKHRYKASGTYQVRLLATNNYASGISPTATQQFTIHVNNPSNYKMNTDFFAEQEKTLNIKMKVNRNPKPEEDLMAYVGYRNRTGANTSGSIVIFYNDLRFIHKSFSLTDKKAYNNESSSNLDMIAGHSTDPELNDAGLAEPGNIKPAKGGLFSVRRFDADAETSMIPSSETRNKLKTLKKKYLDYIVYNYNDLKRDDERFLFLKLQSLPDIVKDTNDNISLTAMIVPNDKSQQPELYQLTIQILVSHDPNQMHLVQNRINYRFMGKKKELTYNVDFQNIGKGPARNISLGIALPRQLNAASLKINKVSPALISCDSVSGSMESCLSTVRTDDSIFVNLKNIYLPGLEQNLVKNEDSTKGFIRYTISFKKKPKKIPFSSRASIRFDNNKPIYTNNATAKFVKGVSPIIIAGYNMSIANGTYSAQGPVQIGYMLSPYAPSRPYFQMELYLGILESEKSQSGKSRLSAAEIKNFTGAYNQKHPNDPVGIETGDKDTAYTKKRSVIQVVPVHFRYNINDWISVGIGVSGQVAISEKTTSKESRNYHGFLVARPTAIRFDSTVTSNLISKTGGDTKMWTDASFAPFADVQVGRVRRTGPFLGLRYYRQFQSDVPNRFFIYAGFRL